MANTFFDRTNDAGGGAFYDRTNDAELGSVVANGDIGTALAIEIAATVAAFATVTLADPIYTGPGSIAYSSNFSGTAVAGDTVRYETTNNFRVLTDGSVQCDVATGSYSCFYNDGTGEVAFTVNLSGTAEAFAALPSATSSTVDGTAQGFIAGAASGALVTVTATTVDGVADVPAIASGDVGTVTVSGPDGSASAPGFTADAQGSIGTVVATTLNGLATGAAGAVGALDVVVATPPDGSVNETGFAEAFGVLPTVAANSPEVRARAQWGIVHAGDKIWTVVS